MPRFARSLLLMALVASSHAAPALAWAQAATPIPFKKDNGAAASAVGGSAIGLLVLSLAAIGAVLWIRKRLNLSGALAGAGRQRMLKVLETERLGPRALLSVVQFNGQHYLLAQSEHGITCVASVPAAAGSPATLPEAAP